jgi:hypothetical protein
MSILLKHPLGKGSANILDSLSDLPPDSSVAKWLYGLIFPALIGIYSAKCIITEQGIFIGRNKVTHLAGIEAICLGLALTGLAVFLHTHFFWGNSKLLIALSETGKIIGLLLFIGGLFSLIWNMLI